MNPHRQCADSWGVWFPDDPRQTPWQRFMDEVAEAGYEWIELGPYGYLPADIDRLKRELDGRNLRVTSAFAMGNLEDPGRWTELEQQVEGAGELLAATGAGYWSDRRDLLDLSRRTDRAQDLGREAWRRLVDRTHR